MRTRTQQDGKIQVRVLKTFAEMEELRDFWSAAQWFPESDLEFVKFIIKSRPEILHPYVLVLSRENQPVALLVGRLESGQFQVKVGYKVIWRTKVRRLAIFYGGFIGQSDPEITDLAVRRLLQSVREEKADMLAWSGVQTGTYLHRLLTRAPNPLCRDYLGRAVQHWRMKVPASLDEFLGKRMSKKHRYWAKRLFRQLEEDFPQSVQFRTFSSPGEMDELFRDVTEVARKTYQWGLGVGFRDDAEHKERLQLEAVNGWHRGYVLYLKGAPVAFWICIVYQGIAYSAFTGYDPHYRKHELGTIVFLRMIGELAREQVQLLDFGPGTALYKERFGDSSFEEMAFCTFAPTGRGIFLNGLRTITEGPLQATRVLLRRFGLEQRVKKVWRRFATPPKVEAGASEPQV